MNSESPSRRLRVRAGARLAALVALIWSPSGVRAAPPDALWHVVHDLCMVDQKLLGRPTPCLEVNLAGGYAVVPDPAKRAHLLLVPTRRLKGIEDPRLLDPEAPNYWREAWAARRWLAARVRGDLPRDAIALAINSVSGRSQDQLHIHISCIEPAFGNALSALAPNIDESWSTRTIFDRRWRVRLFRGDELDLDLFRVVAQAGETAGAHMGQQTIMAVGARTQTGPGFYLLTRDTGADVGDHGSAEHMLDEQCLVARNPSQTSTS